VESRFGTNKYWNLALDLYPRFTLGGDAPINASLTVGYGFSFTSRFWRVSGSLGPSIVRGWDYVGQNTEYESYFTVGGSGRAQGYFTPIPEFGVGLELLGIYNSHSSISGVRPSIFFQRTF